MSLKEFTEKTSKSIEEILENNTPVLKKYVKDNSQLSKEALVCLVILSETDVMESDYKDELLEHDLINGSNAITIEGKNLVESQETIDMIKSILKS